MDWKKNWTIIHDPEKVKEGAVPFAFDVDKELVTGEMCFDSKNKVIYTSIPVEKSSVRARIKKFAEDRA